jgi:ATP-dependent DNA helicase DinG
MPPPATGQPAGQPTSPPTDGGTGDPTAKPGDRAADLLARVTAGLVAGEDRPQQLVMCRAVAGAMESGRHLVVQAGTGTGKSLAYLVPATTSGRKVVVATATKALQDQLADKDLPALSEVTGDRFTFAVLKGRANYLCRQRAAEIEGGGIQQRMPVEEGGEENDAPPTDGDGSATATGGAPTTDPGDDRLVSHVRRLLRWADRTPTGDRADLDFEPHPRAWSMVSVGPRECPGAFRCPSGRQCFAEAARARAAEADLVVVNTHLYGAHLASEGAVLPEHDVVIFDEAHEVEEVMTQSLGAEVTPGRLRAVVAAARSLARGEAGPAALADLTEVADRLQRALAERVGSRVLSDPSPAPTADPENEARQPAGRERGRGTPTPPTSEEDLELARLLELATTRLDRLTGLVRAGEGDGAVDGARQARALSAMGHLGGDLARLAGRTGDEVAWVDGESRAPVLRLSPIDVGPPLAEQLWGQVTAVLTSATIPPRLDERLGLGGFPTDEISVGSPFDYRSRSLLYVARHLPDRRRPESEPALLDELEALIRAAGGRTLALFTSRRATATAAAELRERLPYRLLEQGELPKSRLLREFAEDETSCLFATLGFWQGVDVPGRSLSLVTLDRLPFPRPDDPLLQARRDRAGERAFRMVDLPRAATLLAQGAGRLIRSADDAGVVAVLDSRLATAGYRGVLLSGLPPMRRTTDRRQVAEFLRRWLDEGQ